MRILIAEDRKSLAGVMGRALETEGHDVTLVHDGEQALKRGMSGKYDLMLLDAMLPRMDGFAVIRKLRGERIRVQTVIVSARDTMQNIIEGLDAGADDYVTKPFALDVLLAKVRASERRLPVEQPQTLSFEDLVLRPHNFELQRGARIETLTRTECAILETLMRRAGAVVPRNVLLEDGWGGDADVSMDTLYVFIHTLRSKITQPGEVELLHTVRGVGYSMRPGS